MLFHSNKICFIGAHPDDIELGCGALISNISKTSHIDIVCVTLSKNQKNPHNKNLIQEHFKSLTSLNIHKENIIFGDFETRKFSSSRQEICDFLFEIKRNIAPDIIFVHSFSDAHQDHEVLSKETLRVFRVNTILGFEIPSSSYKFAPSLFIEVDEEDVQNKIRALMHYKTYNDKYYFSQDAIKSTIIRNGILIEKKYAEAFDVIKMIGSF